MVPLEQASRRLRIRSLKYVSSELEILCALARDRVPISLTYVTVSLAWRSHLSLDRPSSGADVVR